MRVTMSELRAAHPKFFDRKTCRMFGDVSYKILTHKVYGQKYLVRLTAQWSDMFGGPKSYCYRLNPIGPGPEFKILPLIDKQFRDLDEVKDWLKEAQ